MEKQEFIDRLRSALNGRIPPAQLEDTVDYYRDYINVEMRKGKTEQEVLELLGDPRLIARTIIQTSGSNDFDRSEPVDPERQQDEPFGFGGGRRVVLLPGWLLGIVFLLLFLLILGIIFSILSFLAPILIVLAAVVLLTKIFRDWLH